MLIKFFSHMQEPITIMQIPEGKQFIVPREKEMVRIHRYLYDVQSVHHLIMEGEIHIYMNRR